MGCLTLRYALIHILVRLLNQAFTQLHNIVRIRPSLNFGDAETIIHAFITSRLDYSNSFIAA